MATNSASKWPSWSFPTAVGRGPSDQIATDSSSGGVTPSSSSEGYEHIDKHQSHEDIHEDDTPSTSATDRNGPTSRAGNGHTDMEDNLDGEEEVTPEPARSFPTRMCRFCWADVQPTVEIPSTSVPTFLQPQPRVTYVDEDPDLGELVKPCMCKGTRRYVHEGCLKEMRVRMVDWERHYHECDICHFKYRTERVWFAHFISSRINQMLLTVFALLFITFLLGFAADPILNLYLEPYATVAHRAYLTKNKVEFGGTELEDSVWIQHFVKGLASVGVLSFANALTTITSPWQWWNLRNTFFQGSGRAGTTGRERVANISWVVLLVGVATALWKIYSLTHFFAARYLLKISDRVKNVKLDDDDQDIKAVLEARDEHPKSE